MEMNDSTLKRVLNSTFNKNHSNINDTQVLAAVITAASKMARCSDIVSETVTVEQLLDLYQKMDDASLASLIGMGPQYVNDIIGYHVDFNDYGDSMYNYNTQKATYDSMYSAISQRSLKNTKDVISK